MIPLPPIPGPLPLSEVETVGHLIHWVVALLLLLLFSQLPRFGAHRDLLWTWLAAWVALLVGESALAAGALGMLLHTIFPGVIGAQILGALALPARLTFLVLVTVAAVRASGRRIGGPLLRQLVVVVFAIGLVLASFDRFDLARRVQLLATPVLFFGSAQLVLAAARGERQRGLTFLALGMVVFAGVATLAQLFPTGQAGFLPDAVRPLLDASSSYMQALATGLLGAAVVVLVVQDSVLEVARTREEHLRDVGASEARLKRIIEAAGEAIVTFGPERRIDMANVAAARLFRIPAGSVVGRRLDDLLAIGNGGWDDALAPVFAGQPAQATLTATAHRPGDASFPVEFSVGPLEQGEHRTGGVAIVRDLTQRIAAEAERERFERRVAESEKMLAIGRVVSGVAHELNNPLAVVLGQSEQLVETTDAGELRDGLQLINEQAHRARHIVKDLLAFVRHREDRREPVALADLVARVVATQAGEARKHDVAVTVSLPDQPLHVLVDRLGLEQVLVNLVDNAMDATGAGGRVRVAISREPGTGVVAVEDDGPGVPDEVSDRIFEPFFTTKPTGQGTGLGLAVSVGLLEQHGGSLALENRPSPGIGARFVVRVPLATGSAALEAHGPEAAAPAALRLPPNRDALAWIIDDEPAVRTTLARIFTRWGWQVHEEGDAEATLAALGDLGPMVPTVLLCDLKMPGMNGRDFYHALLAARPDLAERVIFVTGDVVEPDTAQFLASAGREVVEKPFTIAEIARTVERVVAQA